MNSKINKLSRKDFLKKSGVVALYGAAIIPSWPTNFNKKKDIGSDVNISLWDIFSDNFSRNCLSWHHNSHNPIIPAMGNTWKKHWTANPCCLHFRDKHLLYYRGNGVEKNSDRIMHDRIAVAEINGISYNSFQFTDLNQGDFVIDVGKKGSFDDADVLDPTAIIINNQVYLYYSGIGEGKDSIGLAISNDGVSFKKYGKIMNGRAPSIIEKNGYFYMIYQIRKPEIGYVGFLFGYFKRWKRFQKGVG